MKENKMKMFCLTNRHKPYLRITYYSLALITLIFAVFPASACFSPWTNEDGNSITIDFGGGAARWTAVSPALNLLGYKLALLSFPEGTQVDTAVINPGSASSHTFLNIVPGKYGVKAVGSYYGFNFAYGENLEIYAKAGTKNQVSVYFKRLPSGGVNGGIVLDQNSSCTFPAALFSYTTTPVLNFTMKNFGAEDTGTLNFAFSNTNFEFVTTPSALDLLQDNTRSFSIRPVTGLPAGTYASTLGITSSVSGLVLEPDLKLSFTVVPVFYTVTFDSNGGTAFAQKTGVTPGSTITAPTAPIRDITGYYSFDDWYTDPALTVPWNFASDPVTGDITLYANWIPHKEIGDLGPMGGIIFWAEPEGFIVEGHEGSFESYRAYYLEAYPNDNGTLQWAGTGMLIPGLSQNSLDDTDWAIGRGRKNTAIIIAHGSASSYATLAASSCAALGSDWFLPSLEELQALSDAKDNHANLPKFGYYWSSSQINTLNAWSVEVNINDPTSGYTKVDTGSGINVRAIRAF